MTKYLPDPYWASLPTQDYRSRFFVETYREKLSLYSPHFAQARLMNVFGLAKELVVLLAEVGTEDRAKAYIAATLAEVQQCFQTDHLTREIAKAYEPVRLSLAKKVKGGDFSRQVVAQLTIYCRSLLSLVDTYSHAIDAALRDAVIGPVVLSEAERNLERIDYLTGLFITDLLNRGYSPTHLYNRAEMFTRHKNYGKRTFQEQFEHIVGRIRTEKAVYEVVFGVEVHSPDAVSPYLATDKLRVFKEVSDTPISRYEKLTRGEEPNLFVATEVTSTDHVSAAWKAKERIESALDYALTFERDATCRMTAYAVTRKTTETGQVENSINISLLQKFLTSEGGSYFDSQPVNLKTLEGPLNKESKGQLRQCFRHIRLSRESEFTEEKLLNMWIALETLYSFGHGSIIENILRYVPRTYAAYSLSRRLSFFKKLLVDNQIAIPHELSHFSTLTGQFDDATSIADVYSILRSKELSLRLFNSIENKDRLRFNLKKAHEVFGSNAQIYSRFGRSATDVERQVRRIYSIRNKIAHTGHYGGVRPQLITHLYDYVINALNGLYAASQTSSSAVLPLSDLFDSFSMGIDLLEQRLQSPEPILDASDLVPKAFA